MAKAMRGFAVIGENFWVCGSVETFTLATFFFIEPEVAWISFSISPSQSGADAIYVPELDSVQNYKCLQTFKATYVPYLEGPFTEGSNQTELRIQGMWIANYAQETSEL